MSGHDVAADDEADEQELKQLPTGRNYMTPAGWQRMKDELYQLVHKERPEVVNVVSWAAGNGDRSENGDYLYGKRRLREIDRRIRFLTKRLEIAEVVDPETREATDQVFFGATVTVLRQMARNRRCRLSGLMKSISAKGVSVGFRRLRAPCSKHEKAMRYVCVHRLGLRKLKSSMCNTGNCRDALAWCPWRARWIAVMCLGNGRARCCDSAC